MEEVTGKSSDRSHDGCSADGVADLEKDLRRAPLKLFETVLLGQRQRGRSRRLCELHNGV